MIELHFIAEGPTEAVFVEKTLKAHLCNFSIYSKVTMVKTSTGHKGGGNWKTWKKHIFTVIGRNPRSDARFTTLFDLYGLPRDFPERNEYFHDPDSVRRSAAMEVAMARIVSDPRFIPNIQRHEFEALVLPCLDALFAWMDPVYHGKVANLKKEIRNASPEDVNNGPATAPSKRIKRHLGESYDKVFHGPEAIAVTGLTVIRNKCPRFDAWLTKLESLAGPTP